MKILNKVIPIPLYFVTLTTQKECFKSRILALCLAFYQRKSIQSFRTEGPGQPSSDCSVRGSLIRFYSVCNSDCVFLWYYPIEKLLKFKWLQQIFSVFKIAIYKEMN